MKMTIAYLAYSEGCMLSPKKFSHLREPLMLTPTPGIITRISSKALVANKSSVTLGRRKTRYGTRESVTQAAAPSATPISCFLTAASASPVAAF